MQSTTASRHRLFSAWLGARLLAGALLLGWAVGPALAGAQQKLRIGGGLAGLNQYTQFEEPFWTKELSRLSGGQFKADIVPFERAGGFGGDMLRLIQLGVVPFGTLVLGSLAAQYPEYGAPDLAGLNPDMASLKKTVAAFRPYLVNELRKRHRMEALMVYPYPAQLVFCRQALGNLADLAGRRVQVSSTTQADFVEALGGTPVVTAPSEMREQLRAGNTDCAISGALAGHLQGLHQLTSHVHTLAVSWGLAVFGANLAAWSALPPDLRALLGRELPRLEARLWQASAQDSMTGLACNTGAPGCRGGQMGQLSAVGVSAQDQQRRLEIVQRTVLPRWLQRCQVDCAAIWNQTIGPLSGISVPLIR